MKTIKLKPEFTMSKEEIALYRELPDNMPGTHLTPKQKELVNSLYYKFITRNIDNQKWGQPMYKIEQGEKWPSGPRVKDHEAKRFILNNLVETNEGHKALSLKEAARKFHCCISLRPMYAKLVYEMYDTEALYKY